MRRLILTGLLAASVAAGGLTSQAAYAGEAEQYVPLPTYRVGAYASSGTLWWAGEIDYFRYINEVDGGINGVVLLDEPSMGLAPMIVEEIFEIVASLNRSKGWSFLIAEQNIAVSLRHAHRGYVLDGGRVAIEGSPEDLLRRKDLHEIYLGKIATS
jgi:excinuclease UvrABC ATPase subunit